VSGQVVFPASFAPREDMPLSLQLGGWVCKKPGLDAFMNNTSVNVSHLPGIKTRFLGFPVRSTVAIPTGGVKKFYFFFGITTIID
jgi:hypothetical protein